MALLSDFGFNVDSLLELAQQAKAKGLSWINVTIAVNDEFNDKGKNVSMYLQQTKEQVQNKEKKFYIGAGGKTFWTNGKVPDTAPKNNTTTQPATSKPASANPFGTTKPINTTANGFDDVPF